MEIGGTQNSRDDHTRACRSFGSNYHPCSQSRKISIGVMVDSLEKWRPKTTNENEADVTNTENTFRKLSAVGCDISDGEQAKANYKGNQIDQEHNTSPCVSTKLTHSKKPTSEAIRHSKSTIDSVTGGIEISRSNVETSPNWKSALQSDSDNLKKLNRVYSRREGEERGEIEGTERLPSATAHEFFVPEREEAEDKAIVPEDRRQVLRMKLWEILGANSSQTPETGGNNLHPELDINQKGEAVVKPTHNSDTIESDSESLDPTIKRAVPRSLKRNKDVSKGPTTKTRNVRKSASTKKSLEKNISAFNEVRFRKVQNAVTDAPPKSNGKSLGRKGSKVKARTINFLEDTNAGEVQPEIDTSKTIEGPEKTSSIGNSMRSYQKFPPKNHSVFGPENRNKDNGFSLLSAKDKRGKGSNGESARSSFPVNLISDEVQQEIDISRTIEGAKKASSIASIVDAGNENQENGSSLFSAMKRGKKGSKAEGEKINFPGKINAEEVQLAADMIKTAKDVDKASSVGKRARIFGTSPQENSSKFVDAENGNGEKDSSLSAATKKRTNCSLLGIPHRWVHREDFGTSPFKSATDAHLDLKSPTFKVTTTAETFSPGSPPKANHGELSDQSPENYSFNTPVASKPDNYTPDAGTRTSKDSEEAEDSPLTKSEHAMAKQDPDDAMYRSSPEKIDFSESSKEGWTSPDNGTRRDSEFVIHPNKRRRSQENLEFRRFSSTLASSEGLEESNECQRPPEKNEENGLANAISLLALALQRVKSRIKTATSKKCTEVLMSAAEEVHIQLQNAESQFERDLGKLTSLNKSKRKHLETEIEEQQEQLKVIYQKFKVDASQHIERHRSKVEGLREQEKELCLFIEKQKVSQREVLKQMEELIQTQLKAAETRMAAVHKKGREKVLQLKQAFGKCLKEGMLG